ncbi:serine/threonine-protein kinase pakF-like isoform X2 [Homarus americanus]|uniref:serine/threonine-protein kinase pakF-like isoform X2 n=1 Tax=Homarus americanus TaxID=6706 RepID=UPI001C4859AB|nr:serine/threonine-protein kinase pakF-like isoform X2 [Homarus americanus]
MLGRSRMRRGVSLEVIVEEDDNAEVVLDPTPLMEDDDECPDDDDDDDYSENGRSAPSSPEGTQGNGGRGRSGGGGSSAEERRRKRERRRTIGGLSRIRSVSCEALTLLDTSDMDSCCSEWDDDDELSTASSNYVTLNRPISRRRILESSQAQCDSEDSGIEYHSNEDDPVLEDQSSIEDRKETDDLSDDIHDQETATESEDDTVDEPQHQLQDLPPTVTHETSTDTQADSITSPNADVNADINIEPSEDNMNDTSIQENADDTKENIDIQDNADGIQENADDTQDKADDTQDKADDTQDKADDTQDKADDTQDKADDTQDKADDTQDKADDAQDNTDLLLSARNGKQLFEERGKQGAKKEQTTKAKYLQEYKANEVLENNKVVIVERTPPVPTKRTILPRVVVDPAEEELQLKRAAYTIRNKEVQLEELPRPHTVRSVKQLFEDLNTPVDHFRAWCDLGRFRDIKSNPSSKILRFDRSDSDSSRRMRIGSSLTLPRLPSHHKNNVGSTTAKNTNQKSHKNNFCSSTFPKDSSKQNKPLQKLQKQEQVATQGSQPVTLRKPTVHGFNVKKALMEDPRSFHSHSRSSTTSHQGSNHNKTTSNHHNHKSHTHNKSQHPSEMTTDRSDTESLASDISEDSGLSNDSHNSSASSVSTSTYRALDAYASDPSFKWIDPAVMAKIRSVGTTVIFFGPRQRPRGHDGTLNKHSRTTPSGLQVSRNNLPASGLSVSGRNSLSPNAARSTQQKMSKSGPVAAPRIVGVLRKRPANTGPAALTVDTAASDDSRASSPGSRCSDDSSPGKTVRWRNEGDNTVVYDFTRPHPPSAWV